MKHANLYRIFMSLSQIDDIPRSRTSNVLVNDSFAVAFIHLELRRKHKEDYMKEENGKCRVVNKIICSLESV